MLKIRRAREEEMKEIAEICQEEIYDELSLEWVFKWLKSSNFPYLQFFVAEESGKLVGFSGWSLYDRYGKQVMWELSFLVVRNAYKRKGVGRRLVEEPLEAIKELEEKKGLKVVMIMTETEEENEAACQFYQSVLSPCQEMPIPNVWQKEGGKIFYFKDLK